MEFNPAIHSKNYLLNNTEVLFKLAISSSEFAKSSICQDWVILCIKDFKESDETVAHKLARNHSEWAQSEIAKDESILRYVNNNGSTVAHELAGYQENWLSTSASKDYRILKLATKRGHTVAHELAFIQPCWVNSDAARDRDILHLKNSAGISVAHTLAQNNEQWALSIDAQDPTILQISDNNGQTVARVLAFSQPDWINTAAAKDLSILALVDAEGSTVAHSLAECNPASISHEGINNIDILMLKDIYNCTVATTLVKRQPNWIHTSMAHDKRILTIDDEGILLAESMTRKHEVTGITISSIAMRLISQGAAYIHSKPVKIKVSEALLSATQELICEVSEPIVALKMAQALYSTLWHFTSCTRLLQEQMTDNSELSKQQKVLGNAEELIKALIDDYPELLDVEHTIDFFCEPADALLRQLISERNLKEINVNEHSVTEPITDAHFNHGLY
jgi:hypothetical protein